MNTLTRPLATPAAQRATPARSDGTLYDLAVPQGAQRRLARAWLALALAALIGSGLFSLLLVLSRTPGVNAWLPGVDFFRVAPVVHVDLSVLVWFVPLGCLLLSLAGSSRGPRCGLVCLPRLGLAVAATNRPAQQAARLVGGGCFPAAASGQGQAGATRNTCYGRKLNRRTAQRV